MSHEAVSRALERSKPFPGRALANATKWVLVALAMLESAKQALMVPWPLENEPSDSQDRLQMHGNHSACRRFREVIFISTLPCLFVNGYIYVICAFVCAFVRPL